MVLALPAVIVGLVALLIAFAFWQVGRQFIISLLSQTPVIGGWLSSNADNALNTAYAAVIVWAAGALNGLGEVFSIPAFVIHNLVDNLSAGIQGALNVGQWLTVGYIPLIYGQLVNLVWNRYNAATAYANAEVSALSSGLNLAYTNLVNLIWNRFYQAEADANAATAALSSGLNLAYTNLVNLIWNRFYQAEADANAATAALSSGLNLAYTNLLNLIWNRFYQAEADAGAALGAGVSQLEQQIAAAQAQDALRLAAEAATLGGAIAAVQTAVQAIEDSPCMQECATLGNLGQDISQLADLAFIAALIAWVGESTKDPQGAAREVSSVLGDLAQGAAQVVQQVAGVT